MFIYTKDDDAKENLEKQGRKLITETADGVSIYEFSPALSFECEKYEDTWRSARLDF